MQQQWIEIPPPSPPSAGKRQRKTKTKTKTKTPQVNGNLTLVVQEKVPAGTRAPWTSLDAGD